MKWLLVTVSVIAVLTVDSHGFKANRHKGHKSHDPALGTHSPRLHQQLKKIILDGRNSINHTWELNEAPLHGPQGQKLPEEAQQMEKGHLNMSTVQRSDIKESRGQSKSTLRNSYCLDKNLQCQGWAARGECEKNPGYMLTSCPVSCNQCDLYCLDKNLQCQRWAARGECEKNPAYMLTSCPVSCNQCDSYCLDKNLQCQRWAARGECEKNPAYMLTSCPVSCNQCDSYCLDKNLQCQRWAARGECEKNPAYMLTSCPVSCNQCDCSCGVANTGSRIIGGSEINPSQKYPWLVGLQRPGYYVSCGGSIINDKYILTASHCFYTFPKGGQCYYDPPETLDILVGDHHQFSTSDNNAYTAKISMKKHIIHSNFSCDTLQNDFALIELSEAIDLNDVIKPVCLPKDDSKTYESAIGTVAGWGHIEEDGELSKVPLEVDLPILDPDCGGYETITSDMLCAGYPETGGKDSCQADSGGPFVVNENGKYIQVGVVSWGIGCAKKNHPGVYARVSKELEWIKSKSASGNSCNN